MTRTLPLAAAALLLSALPALAQTKPLTPPDVLGKAKTIQFTATLYKNNKPVEASYVVLAQPNKAYVVDINLNTKAADVVYVSDGKTQTEYNRSQDRYTRTEAAANLQDIESRTLAFAVFGDFYDMKSFAKFKHYASAAPKIYYIPYGIKDGKKRFEVFIIDAVTGLPKFSSVVVGPIVPFNPSTMRISFTNWKLNAPVSDAKFAYTPPATAKLYSPPVLLAAGTAAPDFTVQDKGGKPVKLSDYKGKTVVLDFWATWCGPCQSSLPHTTEIAKKYAAKNVVVLAVNVWDSKAAFDGWLPQHPEYAPLHFAIDASPAPGKGVATDLYGVSGIPTQYVIAPSGKIVKSIVGYDPGDTQLEDALKTQ